MRSVIRVSFVLSLLGGCAGSGGSDDEGSGESAEADSGTTESDSETGDSQTGDVDTGDGEGEADGTESLLGQTCTPALGDCSPGVLCCSSDPAALDLADLDAIVLPGYSGLGLAGGLPLFADANNDASRRGICVDDDEVPPAGALMGAPGCPRPCNPLWSASDVEAVCGPNAICCQHVELDPSDCVFDENLGDAGCWRPVTGFDIVGLGGLDATQWGATEHATHQDPGLAADGACETVIAGLPPEVDVAAFRAACQRRLTVADKLGMCLSGVALSCPYAQPTYVDACEQLNMSAGLTGC
jgi:hypothetical protein